MFSGIVEFAQKTQVVSEGEDLVRIQVERPSSYDDISIGDSIAVNGVCLTVEKFDDAMIEFAMAYETLKVIRFSERKPFSVPANIERSLRMGDRIHGHFVTGHVDGLAKVVEVNPGSEWTIVHLDFPEELLPYIWKKGSVTLNGVSLTINDVRSHQLEICLIPETLQRTNLSHLKVGEWVQIEVDAMARAWVHNMSLKKGES